MIRNANAPAAKYFTGMFQGNSVSTASGEDVSSNLLNASLKIIARMTNEIKKIFHDKVGVDAILLSNAV